MSLPMSCSMPRWPASIDSETELLAYLNDKHTPAIGRFVYDRDYIRAHIHTRDETIYTLEDGTTPWYSVVFGRVRAPASYEGGHSTVVIDNGGSAHQGLNAVFEAQLSTLAAPVGHDDDVDCDNSANIRVLPCTDADRTSRSGGSFIELHLSHAGGTHCTFYTPVPGTLGDELEIHAQVKTVDVPLRAGDWVLALVSLHRRHSDVNEVRSYELLARHIRVLLFDMDDNDGSTTSTMSGEEIASGCSLTHASQSATADYAAPEVLPQPKTPLARRTQRTRHTVSPYNINAPISITVWTYADEYCAFTQARRTLRPVLTKQNNLEVIVERERGHN
ncbi:hypothetical protein C8R44DRAFT_727025 [Mycena epipterygia]|nr:hypothetical protein C8R44DRAFT_727025 [Mycena epipterygia]